MKEECCGPQILYIYSCTEVLEGNICTLFIYIYCLCCCSTWKYSNQV